MLSANRWFKLVLNAAFACLVVFIAIEVAIQAIAKRSKPTHAPIEIKSDSPLVMTSDAKKTAAVQ